MDERRRSSDLFSALSSDGPDSPFSRGGTVVARRPPRMNEVAATMFRAVNDIFQAFLRDREDREGFQRAFLEETRRAYGNQPPSLPFNISELHSSDESSDLEDSESAPESGTEQQDEDENEIDHDRIDTSSVEALPGSDGELETDVEEETKQNNGMIGFAKFKDHRRNSEEIIFIVEFEGDNVVDMSWEEVKRSESLLQQLCAKYIKKYVADVTRRGPRPLNDWADSVSMKAEE